MNTSQVELDLKLCQDCRWRVNLGTKVSIFCRKEQGFTSPHIVCRHYIKKKDGEENDKLAV